MLETVFLGLFQELFRHHELTDAALAMLERPIDYDTARRRSMILWADWLVAASEQPDFYKPFGDPTPSQRELDRAYFLHGMCRAVKTHDAHGDWKWLDDYLKALPKWAGLGRSLRLAVPESTTFDEVDQRRRLAAIAIRLRAYRKQHLHYPAALPDAVEPSLRPGVRYDVGQDEFTLTIKTAFGPMRWRWN